MADIVDQGELAHLPAERVWVELERALGERNPEVFVQVLRDCGALAKLLPEVDALFGVPQTAEHHPEIDTGEHTLMALQQAARYPPTPMCALRCCCTIWARAPHRSRVAPPYRPRARGLKLVTRSANACEHPRHSDLALHVCEYHTHCHRALELRGKTLLKLLNATDALRRPDRFEAFLLACEADARGRLGLEQRDYPQADYLRQAMAALRSKSRAAAV